MASTMAMASRHIVSLILHHLSDMKYKERRQRGPDQPVEFLEFRPTLVPSILVNKLWAEEGTSILWRRYPHLPALQAMGQERQQWYADKVEQLFIMSASVGTADSLSFLEHLDWPQLKSLELEVDWDKHGRSLSGLLETKLEHLIISGLHANRTEYIADVVMPFILATCKPLQSIHIGPDTMDLQAPLHNQVFSEFVESIPSIKEIHIMNANIFGKDLLFGRLSQRSNLKTLEMDLDPGLLLLPLLRNSTRLSPLFPALQRLQVKCYPEIALALPIHLSTIVELSMDVARIPEQERQDSDAVVLNDILLSVAQCSRLSLLKVNIGPLAVDFPSAHFLPSLDGTTLIKLAEGCPKLRSLTLLASEPAAIDGSRISAAQFDDFCQHALNLEHLSLKFHPGTTLALEESAFDSLGRHCHRLEVLRLKIALRLPNLLTFKDTLPADLSLTRNAAHSLNPDRASTSMRTDHDDYTEIEAFSTSAPVPAKACFPNLTHLAFARPQSVLSINADSYAASSVSQSSSIVDLALEEELVRCWGQTLLLHFPRLDILEAWSDWTGHDNDSLNYFLPLEEPLASIWEFLSGVEQDLWEDDHSEGPNELNHQDAEAEGSGGWSRGSIDWERASLINEYPEVREPDDSLYLDAYEEEPEDMPTPVGDQEGWLAHTTNKLMTVLSSKRAARSPGDISI
jgi:hypothetical protein